MTALQEKIKDVAKILNLKIEEKDLPNPEAWAKILIDDNIEINFYHDSYRKKLKISLNHSRKSGIEWSDIYHDEKLDKEINVSPDKDAQAIAKDIQRRLIDSGILEKYKDIINKILERINKRKNLEASIADDIKYIESKIGTFWKCGENQKRDLKINKDYGYFEVSTYRLKRETILKIINLIDSEVFND